MTGLHHFTAAQQLRALRRRKFTARRLTEHYLSRIKRHDQTLGAFVTVDPDAALRQADHADELLTRDDAPPLCGLPIGVKDLFATEGLRTTFGSAALKDFVPPADTWTVGLLRDAGAVIVGKTNTPEFGSTCYTENDVTPHPSVTPYATERYASGSSGGAAAAVAGGLLPLAHASDGAGSIRTPAATCHLVGVKPSRGLVSSAPAVPYFSASTEGPIARTVEDAALLLDVFAQPAPGDLYGWRPKRSFTSTLGEPTGRLKIAVWSDPGVGEPHPEAEAALRRATSALRDLGHKVHEVALPARYDQSVRDAIVNWFGFTVATAVDTSVPPEQRHLLRPYNRYLDSLGRKLSGTEAVQAQAVIANFAGTFLAALDEYDIAVPPTTNGPAVPIGYYHEDDDVEGVPDRMLAWSAYTPWANYTGQPAVTVPTHQDADGLPLAVQLVGRQRHDAQVLALAAQLERAGLWSDIHPPCWNK